MESWLAGVDERAALVCGVEGGQRLLDEGVVLDEPLDAVISRDVEGGLQVILGKALAEASSPIDERSGVNAQSALPPRHAALTPSPT